MATSHYLVIGKHADDAEAHRYYNEAEALRGAATQLRQLENLVRHLRRTYKPGELHGNTAAMLDGIDVAEV